MKKEHIFDKDIEYKKCSTCKESKELNCYSNNKPSWDGLKPYCKECANKKGIAYRLEYHEEDLRRKKEWYNSTKNIADLRTKNQLENSSKVCGKCSVELNIKEFRERPNGGFYSVCRDCENKYNKIYRVNNSEIYKANHSITEQRRRKMTKLVISDFNNSEWKLCKNYFNNQCAYCGKILKSLTQDHLIPLSKGGNYTKNNIIPVCRSCNCRKHNKEFSAWYEEQEFYSIERVTKIEKYLSTFN